MRACAIWEPSSRKAAATETSGAYLTRLLGGIDGITPARTYSGCTRNAYHLYMFRYDPGQFAGLSRAAFEFSREAAGV